MSGESSGRPVRDFKEFVGRDIPGIPDFLSPLTAGGVYFSGTAIRAIQPGFVQLPNKLIVPASCARPVQSIDQLRTFLTCEEIFGTSFPIDRAYDELSRIPVDQVVMSVASILHIIRQPGVSPAEYDIHFAKTFFRDVALARVINLLRGSNRTLVVPQAVLKLMQLSLLYSPPDASTDRAPGNVALALMIVTDHLGRREVEENSRHVLKDVPGDLGRELIANQIFNAQLYEPHYLGRFVRIWLQLPAEHAEDPQVVDLEAAYHRYSGVRLRDLIAVTIALWTGSLQHGPVISAEYYKNSALSRDRFNSALSLISASIPALREVIQREVSEGGADWAFDAFNRFPVVRLSNDELIVIDPDIIVRRVFGWAPLFDIEYGTVDVGESKPERRKRIERVKACLRHLAETYVGEVLDSISPSLSGMPRVYHDKQLKKAYSGNRIADAAIDYGDAWVVVETTTTHMRRDSVKGKSDDAIVADLNKFVNEAQQIDSTISCLRDEEEKLTGFPPAGKKKFYPLIVATEGFPTSPITMTLLRDMLRNANILTNPDTMPLEIVDTTELEMIEGVQADGGPNLRHLLDSKASANLALCSMNQYILVEARLDAKRPSRVNRLFAEGMNTAVRELFPGMPLLPDGSWGS